jgi:ribosomal protein L37AE/L43A
MSDEYSDEYARAVLEMLIVNRGGLPEACDFCKQPFTVARYPLPEEAGAWACSECEARWTRREDADNVE